MQDDITFRPIGFGAHDHAGCVAGALAAADRLAARRGLRLTPTRRRVLEILLESHVALGAYDVLRRLEREGRGAQPPVAYRALGFLVRAGLAHRVERLNAYVACARPDVRHAPAFMICTSCGLIAEAAAASPLGGAAALAGFRIDGAVVEATGECAACRAPPA